MTAFKYHKYCVVDVTGILNTAQLADGSRVVTVKDDSAAKTEIKASADGAVAITDQVFVEYVFAKVLDGVGGAPITAKITGAVAMDGEQVLLTDVSSGLIYAGEQCFHYSPASA